MKGKANVPAAHSRLRREIRGGSICTDLPVSANISFEVPQELYFFDEQETPSPQIDPEDYIEMPEDDLADYEAANAETGAAIRDFFQGYSMFNSEIATSVEVVEIMPVKTLIAEIEEIPVSCDRVAHGPPPDTEDLDELVRKRRERARENSQRLVEKRKKRAEDSRAYDPVKARIDRIKHLREIYPNWEKVCEEQECSFDEIQQRMYLNPNYDPFEEDQTFDPNCHPAYGLMSEEERYLKFREVVCWWLDKPIHSFTKRVATVLLRARKMADEERADYYEWVGAQYRVYNRNFMYTHLNSRYAKDIYREFKEKNYSMPERIGANMLSDVRTKKRGMRKVKTARDFHEQARDFLSKTLEGWSSEE